MTSVDEVVILHGGVSVKVRSLIRNPDFSSEDFDGGTKLFELTRHFFPEELQVIEAKAAKTKKPKPGCEAGVADDGQGEGADSLAHLLA